MKIFLDECMPKDLRKLFVQHDFQTVPQAGLAGKKNGALLTLAEQSGWQVLLTMDRGMPHQQNLSGRTISLAIIRAPSYRLPDPELRPNLLLHIPITIPSLLIECECQNTPVHVGFKRALVHFSLCQHPKNGFLTFGILVGEHVEGPRCRHSVRHFRTQ